MLERGTRSTVDLPENLRYLAETLVPPKPGIIVGIATERLVAGGSAPERAYEQLCVPEWRAFCHAVWHGEVPGTCGLITRHMASNAGAKAGLGGGEAGSVGPQNCATALSARTRCDYRGRRRGPDAALGAPRDSSPIGRRRHPRGPSPQVRPEVRGADGQMDFAASGHRLVRRVDRSVALGGRARGLAPGAAAGGSST